MFSQETAECVCVCVCTPNDELYMFLLEFECVLFRTSEKVNRLHLWCSWFLSQIPHYFELFLVLVARFECQMSYLFHPELHGETAVTRLGLDPWTV